MGSLASPAAHPAALSDTELDDRIAMERDVAEIAETLGLWAIAQRRTACADDLELVRRERRLLAEYEKQQHSLFGSLMRWEAEQ